MKVADIKVIKAVKGFLSEIAPKYSDFGFSTTDTLKSKDQEKGSLNFSIAVPSDGFPDILNEDDYLIRIKQILQELLEKDIRYLNVDWSYADSDKDNTKELCCISFDVKLS